MDHDSKVPIIKEFTSYQIKISFSFFFRERERERVFFGRKDNKVYLTRGFQCKNSMQKISYM